MTISNDHEQLSDSPMNNSIVGFLVEILSKKRTTIDDIRIIYQNSSLRMSNNLDDIIKMLHDCEIIMDSNHQYQLNDELEKLIATPNNRLEEISDFIIKAILEKLFKKKILRADQFNYDINKQCYRFNNNLFSNNLFIYRNTLVDCGFFIKQEKKQLFVSHKHEKTLISILHEHKKISLDNLLEELERQRLAGDEAEKFVIEYERKRLRTSSSKKEIIQISLIDVTAGYDILSFQSESSIVPDMFIEVKAISHDVQFYISKNEIEKAKLYGERYSLYLVELEKIHEPEYDPIIIKDPIKTIMNPLEWKCEPQNFLMKRINIRFTSP